MATSPILETARLRIEPFEERHIDERYVGWLNDPQVVRFSEQRFRTHTLDSCRHYWQSFADTPNYFWAMMAKERAPCHIGNLNAYVDLRQGVADLGILIGERETWGQGYGLEAWCAICHFLFDQEGIRKISAGCLSVNLAMVGIMKRAGMVPDGVRTNHHLFEGRPVDIVHAALFADQWRRDARPTELP